MAPIIPPIHPPRTAGSAAAPSAAKGGVANPAPNGMRAWTDLRNSLANHLPYQLYASQHAGVATLRLLARRHKVGH